jgi:hypothetical protein
MESVLKKYGIKMGSQLRGEKLYYDWSVRKWDDILNLCNTAQAFQDTPFCLPYTYQILDYKYPGSKFILTVRDSSQQWYNSWIRFHSKVLNQGTLPTYEVLCKRMPNGTRHWDVYRDVFNATQDHIYDAEKFQSVYNTHIACVLNFFIQKPQQLLVLNLSQKESSLKLAEFIGATTVIPIPHENKT